MFLDQYSYAYRTDIVGNGKTFITLYRWLNRKYTRLYYTTTECL